jgi:hypothetical protein
MPRTIIALFVAVFFLVLAGCAGEVRDSNPWARTDVCPDGKEAVAVGDGRGSWHFECR